MHHCWAVIENKNTPSIVIRVVLRIDKHGFQKELNTQLWYKIIN